MSSCLLVIFISQCCLNPVHAKLQVQDVISSLDGLIETVLQKKTQQLRLPFHGWARETELEREESTAGGEGEVANRDGEATLVQGQ